jgi:hypothetical protein
MSSEHPTFASRLSIFPGRELCPDIGSLKPDLFKSVSNRSERSTLSLHATSCICYARYCCTEAGLAKSPLETSLQQRESNLRGNPRTISSLPIPPTPILNYPPYQSSTSYYDNGQKGHRKDRTPADIQPCRRMNRCVRLHRWASVDRSGIGCGRGGRDGARSDQSLGIGSSGRYERGGRKAFFAQPVSVGMFVSASFLSTDSSMSS